MEESFVGEEERNHARERPIFRALDTFRGHAPFLSIFPINSVGGGTLEECLPVVGKRRTQLFLDQNSSSS